MKRTSAMFLGGGLFLGFCYLVSLIPTYTDKGPVFAILSRVPFGWWHFLKRNLSELTLNWNTIVSGIVYSVLILLVGNWVLRALFKQVQISKDRERPVRPWRWRWTVCAYAALWLLFAIAFAAAGIFMHTTWLAEYRGPWYEEETGSFYELNFAREAILDVGGYDMGSSRKEILSDTNVLPWRDILLEKYDFVLYTNRANELATYLIIPRRHTSTDQDRFCVVESNQATYKPMSDLLVTITKLDGIYARGYGKSVFPIR